MVNILQNDLYGKPDVARVLAIAAASIRKQVLNKYYLFGIISFHDNFRVNFGLHLQFTNVHLVFFIFYTTLQ